MNIIEKVKFIVFTISACTLLSCGKYSSSPSNTNSPSISDPTTPVVINEHIHSSLPADWINEYNTIMTILKNLLPLYQTYYNSIDIYAWNDKVTAPYPGIDGGAYISVKNNDDHQKLFVIEVNNDEFLWNHINRYSVIAHEYFHTYQMTLNSHMNKYDDHPTSFKTKWLIEGAASSFDYLYIQQYYSQNKFASNQTIVDSAATQHPSIFENYGNDNKDINGTSSLFLVLVLAKELQLAGHSESKAFRLMCKDFMQANPNKKNWPDVFQTTFNMSVSDFYSKVSSYKPSINTVSPSTSLTLESIFN
ncbi:MAG: hypothetical protein QF569_21680 [Candidatus Poribacteria bacterium]|jgi:hypothetical protein|nr:hypothetical protein [Candidatus Poribacteria bacterium]